MKIYFLSSQPCALTFNGLYYGVTDTFEHFAKINLSDKLFVQFSPQNALPISFFLTEDIRFTPPSGCDVYLLPNAIAIYAHTFAPIDSTLKIITQERFGNNLITVFQQGTLQISLETEKGFFVSTLPPAFSHCSISFQQDLFFIKGENQLAIYTKNGERVFLEQIAHYTIEENTLIATLPLSDRLKRQAICHYVLTENGCYQNKFVLQKAPESEKESKENIHDELIAYAFFECVLIGADYAQYLCESLQETAEKLRAFLGDFKDIVLSQNPKECGLVYVKKPNLYEVIYYTVDIENGLITDVHR